MIVNILFGVLMWITGIFLSVLPSWHLWTLPYIGNWGYATLVMVVGYWNMFISVFPYIELPWHLFLYVVVPLEITLLVAKVLLGNRAPAQQVN